jgi:hypothetical protein
MCPPVIKKPMPKIIAQDMIDLGFLPEMFKKDNEAELSAYITAVIAEQADILLGRIGSAAYNSTTSPTDKYVKRAEKCLTAAELIQRRINIILGNVAGAGQEIDVTHEGAQKKVYLSEANDLIAKLVSGTGADSNDFATGVLVTSHFESTTLAGEEQT